MTAKVIPVVGEFYSARELKANGWSPCTHCRKNHLCASQCVWAHWNQGGRADAIYQWDGTLATEYKVYKSDPANENGPTYTFALATGDPIFSDETWHRYDPHGRNGGI